MLSCRRACVCVYIYVRVPRHVLTIRPKDRLMKCVGEADAESGMRPKDRPIV